MSDHEPIDTLIGQVYDAALDETLWPDFLERVADVVSGSSAHLFLQDMRTNAVPFMVTVRTDPHYVRLYETYYASVNPWIAPLARIPQGVAIASHRVMTQQVLTKTEFYSDYLRPRDIGYAIGGMAMKNEAMISVLSIYRPDRAGGFSDRELTVSQSLLPHLRRALQIRDRLANSSIQQSAALDALERIATATLIVSRDGRILYANSQAQSLLRDGDAIRAVGGRLATIDRGTADRLTRAIGGVVDTAAERGGFSGGGFAIPREDRLPLTLLVAPFRPARNGFGASAPAAILFIRDPEQPTLPSLTLQGIFGFTPAEAAVASALADGKSVEDIAALHGVSLNTVRTHLKTIFAKTGTNRQAQLVALMLRSVAAIAPK